MNALVQRHRRSLVTLLFFCCWVSASGQLKADFSATSVSGCSPLVVYFSDSSSGNPTQWKWDLGNGVTSFLRNPSATYFNPGTYTVKLTVSNASGADSVIKSHYITVYSSPSVDFSFDKITGCYPLPVRFTDKSTAGSGTMASWQWDFGDGTISTEQNPLHIYTSAGNFTVTLRVTNSNGCVKSFSMPQAINIATGVKASFTTTDPGACPAPTGVQFTNTSTGPGPLKFVWMFGDGTTSTATSPAHTYTANGNYSVTLIATSPQGCVDTAIKANLFKIGSAKADFSFPATICANSPVTFTNTSTPTPASVRWDFGDATYSTALNPVKTFTSPAMMTVQLISNFGTCMDTVKKLVSVSPKPVADFTATKQSACSVPVTVQFASLSSGTNFKYAWDFGDGSSATTATPSHTYTKEGTYSVRLIVTNNGGCSDTILKKDLIKVQKPRISLSGLPMGGCVPVVITPTATISAGQTIASYAWDFGDGNTSTAAQPSHTYNQAGTYTVKLVVTTVDGCSDTAVYNNAVRAGNKPTAAFQFKPDSTCSFDKVFFTDESTGADQWLWNFGDGGTSTEQSPFHQFGDTGWHRVTLIVFSNTCPDTLVVRKAVYVNPPVSIFKVTNDCDKRFTKQFTDVSQGAKTWFWEFGDGTTSSEQHPKHTYADTGTYKVKLTVTNGRCTHWSVRTISVIDEKAVFSTADTVLCRNSNATFTSSGINRLNVATWNWNFGDGTSSRDAMKSTHLYTKSGTYTVTLTITDLLGCTSSQSLQIKVYGPTANFVPATASQCLKDNLVTFTDGTATDGNHPIVKWIWNYGDNVIDTLSSAPFQHRYDSAGTYNISLTVEDNFGCRDSKTLSQAVIIAQPIAAFSVSDTATCTGKPVVFTNRSTGVSPTYAWSFGNGKHSTAIHPTHRYSDTGLYSVKLVVTDRYGCTDSIEKERLVSVTYPKALFTLSDSVGTCPPLLVHFTNQSTNYKSIVWDFGDGNNSKLDTPSHFYSQPGTFIATLIATGPGGCTDTMRRTIVVKGPSGTFTYEPLTGCQPLTVNFTANTKNNVSFIWDFSDGSTRPSKEPTISHTYESMGDFVPKIILTDAAGCSVPIEGQDTIRVKGVSTAFAMNETTFCNDGRVQFRNHTVSNDLITAYQWNFGDGITSTEANPAHHYAKPGTYTVQLLATTQSGCYGTTVLTDTINVYPNPVVQITGDTAACAPARFTFNGVVNSGNASTLKWTWNLANGQTSALQNPAVQVYTNDGAYTISTIATDEHGCKDTATWATSVHPVPQTNAGLDQWICRGSAGQLKATGAETYRWTSLSSLSCTDCDSPLAIPTDSTQYVVTGSNRFGCSRTDSVVIRVHQPFTLQVEAGDTICVGKTIMLSASGADQYTWTPALDVKNPSVGMTTATPQTTTLYKVVAKDNANCFTDTGSVFIKVWPIPTIKTETAVTLAVGNTITLKPEYSSDVSAYQWTNGETLSCTTCPAPVARPKTETKYGLAVKNDGGCEAQTTITVQVICNNGNLFIPNTFSPNTDGRNDRFYPRGTGISSIKSLKVYNRWGELVFSRENFNANDATAGWDGNFKGQVLTPDVYIYTCEVVCMNNEVLQFKGDVTLLR